MKMNKDTLFMTYPSTWWHDLWREGLVTGNGIVGANVYGGVKEETVMITHSSLWHNGVNDKLPDVSDAFRRQRKMMDEENFKEASWEVVNELNKKGYKSTLESPFALADLSIKLQPIKGFADYVRYVHMDSGEVGCEWKDGDSLRTSTLFVSRTDDLIIKRITSSDKDLDVTFNIDAHVNKGSDGLKVYGQHILDSKCKDISEQYIDYTAVNKDDGNGLYGVSARIIPVDGEAMETKQGVRVVGSSEIIVVLKVFVNKAVESRVAAIDNARKYITDCIEAYTGTGKDLSKLYSYLITRHKKLHFKYYNSADFSLGYRGKYHSNEELLAAAFRGKQSIELIEKLWKYGRYLFICGTCENGFPFSMYGLWAGDYRLMWPHNMANENIEMIYWHAFAGNLLEFNKAFFEYYNDKLPTFKDNAKKLFGMKGIYMTAGTTPGVDRPNQVVPVIMNWVGAAGWIAQHYYRYYRHTGDEKYLTEVILPYMNEVADFYEDFIEFYPNGNIKFYPSVSPENTPGNFMPPAHIQMAHPMPTTVNSTIDLAIVKEFFTSMCKIAKEHGMSEDKIAIWNKILTSIPEYKTTKDGAIKEWQDDRFEERYDHRHLSHIYPVFPGYEINDLHGNELMPAFKKAVELRKIDAQTGWSMAHMAAIYARMEEADKAMECLDNMAKSSLTNNFFTLHNDWRGMNISLCMDPAPVQLDAIMGYVNAVQEMVLYSSEDFIKLLPAIPEELAAGSIKNFRYVNGYISMRWNKAKNKFRAEIESIRKHKISVKLPKAFGDFMFSTIGVDGVRNESGAIVEWKDGLLELCLEKGERVIIEA
ncbi:MAG: glycoside hydrolase N-terminal domain-containing protein [Lachnospiraceae bacterium]|nr:glycoside hydrolase N-terminal domain-containing protein [Lachnospiraceae bacterium]